MGFSVVEKAAQPSPRAAAIVTEARRILDTEGREGLTMRRLGEAVGIRAPSLYRHFPDKAAVEAALMNTAFEELGAALEAGFARDGESLATLGGVYREFARSQPHLYRLLTTGPLPRERLQPGVESRAAAPLIRVTRGDADLARSIWAFAHGMVILELDDRFPHGADLDAAWAAGLAAFAGFIPAGPRDESEAGQ
jgi:AcrR family transcriptional regulator